MSDAQPTKDELTTLVTAVVNAAFDCGQWDEEVDAPLEDVHAKSKDAQRALEAYVQRVESERDQYKLQAEINAQTVVRQAQEIRNTRHEFQEETRAVAAERSWRDRQGDEYRSY